MREVYDNKNYMGCVIVKYPISVCYYSENVKCPNFNAKVIREIHTEAIYLLSFLADHLCTKEKLLLLKTNFISL